MKTPRELFKRRRSRTRVALRKTSSGRPRLSVHRSSKHLYAQVIDDARGKLAINLGVYGTPETFIIDQKGIIRYKHVGAVSPDLWHDQLKPLVLKLEKGT